MENNVETIKINFLPFERWIVQHTIHFEKVSHRGWPMQVEICYSRPLSVYADILRQAKEDDASILCPSQEQEQLCMDDFDRLLVEAVKKKYPAARGSISWILFDRQEERMLNRLKGHPKGEVIFSFRPRIEGGNMKMYEVCASPTVYDFPMTVLYTSLNMVGLVEEPLILSYDISQQEMLEQVKRETSDFRL